MKRTRKRSRKPQLYICKKATGAEGKCWYTGNCPHRKPHAKIIRDDLDMCVVGFCSFMKLTTGCIPIKKEE